MVIFIHSHTPYLRYCTKQCESMCPLIIILARKFNILLEILHMIISTFFLLGYILKIKHGDIHIKIINSLSKWLKMGQKYVVGVSSTLVDFVQYGSSILQHSLDGKYTLLYMEGNIVSPRRPCHIIWSELLEFMIISRKKNIFFF